MRCLEKTQGVTARRELHCHALHLPVSHHQLTSMLAWTNTAARAQLQHSPVLSSHRLRIPSAVLLENQLTCLPPPAKSPALSQAQSFPLQWALGLTLCSLAEPKDEKGMAQLSPSPCPQHYFGLGQPAPHLFWLFMDSTMLVFSSFISTLLGMSFSVSLLSTDRDFEGSPGPGEGQRESQEGLFQTPTLWSRKE